MQSQSPCFTCSATLEDTTSLQSSITSFSCISAPSSVMIPEPWEQRMWSDVPFRIDHPSLLFSALCPVCVIPTYSKSKLQWWGFRHSLSCGYNEKTLRNQLNTMSNINSVSPRAYDLPNHRLLANSNTSQCRFHLGEQDLNSSRKGLAITMTPMAPVLREVFLS